MTTAKRARAAKPAPKPAAKGEKIGKTPTDPTRPIGKGNPPRETQFKPGGPGGPGRSKKIELLQDEILDAFNEAAPGFKSRLHFMIRSMMTKPAGQIKLLEYVYGPVTQRLAVEDVTQKDDSELVAELAEFVDAARARARAGVGGGIETAASNRPPAD